jgi:hypothetical protein
LNSTSRGLEVRSLCLACTDQSALASAGTAEHLDPKRAWSPTLPHVYQRGLLLDPFSLSRRWKKEAPAHRAQWRRAAGEGIFTAHVTPLPLSAGSFIRRGDPRRVRSGFGKDKSPFGSRPCLPRPAPPCAPDLAALRRELRLAYVAGARSGGVKY